MRINSSLLSTLGLKHGVPQGTLCFGPSSLLFNLYINDLPLVCKTCKVKSYVDDSQLYVSFSNKEIDGGLDDLKQDLLRVAALCCVNCLLINSKKTKFCVFGTGKLLCQTSIPPITFLGKELSVAHSVKALGVIVDKN